jgi:hypothetical protein
VGEIVLPSVAEALSESNTIVRALFVARLAAEHVALAGKSPSATCITRSQRPSKAHSRLCRHRRWSPMSLLHAMSWSLKISHTSREVIAKIK